MNQTKPVVSDHASWFRDIDWEKVASLRLLSSAAATGVMTGLHRSSHHGDGVEFGGHRPYVPGDDLRWLDRHAMLRHDKLIVRQFQTERSRSVLLVIDATASMGFRSPQSKYTKLEFAIMLAATTAKVVLRQGDRVGIAWIGGSRGGTITPTASKNAFDRCVVSLAVQQAAGDALARPHSIDVAFALAAKQRADITILLSDLLDIPGPPGPRLLGFSGHDRDLRVVQLLDRQEQEFPFRGAVRLRALEGDAEVEAIGQKARGGYLERLERLRSTWREEAVRVGGRFTSCITDDSLVQIVGQVIGAPGRRLG